VRLRHLGVNKLAPIFSLDKMGELRDGFYKQLDNLRKEHPELVADKTKLMGSYLQVKQHRWTVQEWLSILYPSVALQKELEMYGQADGDTIANTRWLDNDNWNATADYSLEEEITAKDLNYFPVSLEDAYNHTKKGAKYLSI
jgi:hypothetical protein